MSSALEHYQTAEKLLAAAREEGAREQFVTTALAMAQVSATLALAGATVLADSHTHNKELDELTDVVAGKTPVRVYRGGWADQ